MINFIQRNGVDHLEKYHPLEYNRVFHNSIEIHTSVVIICPSSVKFTLPHKSYYRLFSLMFDLKTMINFIQRNGVDHH